MCVWQWPSDAEKSYIPSQHDYSLIYRYLFILQPIAWALGLCETSPRQSGMSIAPQELILLPSAIVQT